MVLYGFSMLKVFKCVNVNLFLLLIIKNQKNKLKNYNKIKKLFVSKW